MAAEAAVQILSDEEALRYTQSMRHRLVEDICADGKMPIDPKDRATMLMALDGMDRQALTKQRLAGDAAGNDATRLVGQALNKLFEKVGNRSPFEKPVEGGRVIEELMPDTFVEDLNVVPGETEIGLANLDYESFHRQLGKPPA
jgi:hypothetical protein